MFGKLFLSRKKSQELHVILGRIVCTLRKKQKEVCISSLLSLCCTQVLADQSAWFVGLDVSAGIASNIALYPAYSYDSTNGGTLSSTANSIGFGLVAGYKQMFTKYFGLRYYANVDFYPFFVYETLFPDADNSLLNAGINVDILVNFYHIDNLSIGGFAGVQFAMNGWNGRFFDFEKQEYDKFISGKTNYEASNANLVFNTNLNVGVRLNAGHHNLDIYAIIPFMRNKLTEYKSNVDGTSVVAYSSSIKAPYIVGLRYAYDF